MGIIAKQSIQGTIVTYLGVAVGFVTTFFVLTRFLTAEEIGLARVLVDAATLFIGLAQLGTSSSIIRFYPHFKEKGERLKVKGENTEHGFFFWTILIPLIGFGLFSVLYCACYTPLSHWFGEKSPLFVEYYYMVLPMAFFMLYQTVFETNANVRMHIVIPRAVRELITRIGLLAAYLLYSFRIVNIDGFVIALCAVYAVAMLCNIIYLFSLGEVSLRPDWQFVRNHPQLVKQYAFYTGFLLISAVASVLAPTLSSFFITAQMGLNYTGVFAIATYIAVMVSIPYRSVTAIAAPQLANAIKNNNQAEITHLIHQVSTTLLFIGGMILCAIWLNIDLIFHILPNGETYASARSVVLILGTSQLFIAVCSFTSSALNYSRYYAFSLLFSFILTALSILLNNLLIPHLGMEGAAMSNLISYAIYFLLIVLTVRLCQHTATFTNQHLKILLLILCVLLTNFLWMKYLPINNIWISSILRTTILMGGACAIAWFKNLSPEINQQVRALGERLKAKGYRRRIMRYFIKFSYLGTEFHGSQRQPNGITVQETMEQALKMIFREEVPLTFAGRTDAGVHAREMYAHMDVGDEAMRREGERIVFRLNGILPNSIAIHAIVPVTDEAHARFTAKSRTYEYHIVNHKDPFLHNLATRVRPGLDFNAMNEAAKCLIGRQDFASFCRSNTDVKTTICDLTYAQWEVKENGYAVFTITADRFLRNMVRAVVGTLFEVGRGKMTPEQFAQVISQHTRTAAGDSAPAEGLYLTQIIYPEEIWL